MHVFEVVVALLLLGAALTAVAKRIGAPYPALVALAGAGLALVPSTPTLVLDPDLALALFVAPVLLDSAFDSPIRDLRTHWRSVASLAVGAVVLTVGIVAVVVRALVPSMPWSVAIALGAIVAPPDAAAASAVLRQLRLPHRLLVILEGESLFNDASALLVYRLAVGVALGQSLSPARAVPTLLLVTGGSVVLGLALSRAMMFFSARIRDVGIAVVVQFCATFAVWTLADRLHLSAILTMVVFAMATSPLAAKQIPGRMRVPSYAVWESAVFVLNVLAFILVGFQLKAILERVDRPTLAAYAGTAAAVCAATIVARFVYVGGAVAFGASRPRGARDGGGPTRRTAVVVAWSGMRGIVTLAAALALPTEGASFPHRDGTVEREVRLGRVQIANAALRALSTFPVEDTADVLRRRFALTAARASAGVEQDEGAVAIVRAATDAEREKLLALRAAGEIGAEAFQQLEQELDHEEMYLEQIAGTPLDA